MAKQAISAEQLIAAIPSSGGNKTLIGQKLGCSGVWVAKLLERYPTARKIYDEEESRVDDSLENTAVLLAIGKREKLADGSPGKYDMYPNVTTLLYLLKTRPGMREKYGPEVKKIIIDHRITANEDAILKLIEHMEAAGQSPSENFQALINRYANADAND